MQSISQPTPIQPTYNPIAVYIEASFPLLLIFGIGAILSRRNRPPQQQSVVTKPVIQKPYNTTSINRALSVEEIRYSTPTLSREPKHDVTTPGVPDSIPLVESVKKSRPQDDNPYCRLKDPDQYQSRDKEPPVTRYSAPTPPGELKHDVTAPKAYLSTKLESRLLTLVGYDRDTTKRLIKHCMEKHPGKSEPWYWEKVIWDLERDRRSF